ncbi:MAG: FAD-dependent oxidoreductase [Algoriphagus sp.]|uniref:FAD-dependent oxidoreductase n=1 Tax=Algoriphagus sp. TaxID=1872435 RepID=UPI00260A734E|nr:FAD-dependent oxidoreductase [Algoriphagus sp.]MDG1277766.1 FAD-dependent oxidoreductase [Algoriphagus sp.]
MNLDPQALPSQDVLVIGAGSAGCLAAMSARENSDFSVLLVERYGFLGGTSTQMLDTFYGFFTPGKSSKKIVGGLVDRVVNRLNTLGEIFLRPNTYGAGTGVNYNPERLKLVWDQLLDESQVKVMLHTTLIDVVQIPEGRYQAILWNKSGIFSVIAKRVIDASGDADFCHLAGFDYEVAGENEPAQSMTTTFRMANVDFEEFEKSGGKKLLKEVMNSTSMPLPRKEGSAHEMNVPKCISTVAVKVVNKNALINSELNEAEKEGRRQAFIFEEFFRKEIPGYQNSKIVGLSTQIGVRETRRVYGNHRLTKDECMDAEIPADSIFLCGAPIEDHSADPKGESETIWEYIPKSGIYGVPYGTIIPKKSDTLWAVGRCFSATHDAHASCRSMAQTMSMGQAAGLATQISLEKDISASNISSRELQERLLQIGAVLEVPNQEARIGRGDWLKNQIQP